MHGSVPRIRGPYAWRLGVLVLGLAVFAFGIVLQLESELGLSPWDVLSQGISEQTPLSFGVANIAVAFVVLGCAWALGARIGVGTVANAMLIGLFIDGFAAVGVVARLSDQPLVVRIGLLATGIAIIGFATGLYIGAWLGAGPRDSLMLVVSQRTRLRIGLARALVELSALATGFALGGTVGIGTVAFALAVGPSVELGFRTIVRCGLAEAGPRAGAG